MSVPMVVADVRDLIHVPALVALDFPLNVLVLSSLGCRRNVPAVCARSIGVLTSPPRAPPCPPPCCAYAANATTAANAKTNPNRFFMDVRSNYFCGREKSAVPAKFLASGWMAQYTQYLTPARGHIPSFAAARPGDLDWIRNLGSLLPPCSIFQIPFSASDKITTWRSSANNWKRTC